MTEAISQAVRRYVGPNNPSGTKSIFPPVRQIGVVTEPIRTTHETTEAELLLREAAERGRASARDIGWTLLLAVGATLASAGALLYLVLGGAATTIGVVVMAATSFVTFVLAAMSLTRVLELRSQYRRHERMLFRYREIMESGAPGGGQTDAPMAKE